MTFYTRFLIRYALWIAILGTLLAIPSTYFSVQLYKNLRTNLEELLPTTARSVQDLNEVSTRLESIDNIAVLVFSSHPEASKRFVQDLEVRLKRVPRTIIASVETNIQKELEFFRQRRALYMDIGDITKIRDYIRDRLLYERNLYNPLNIFSESDIPEPRLDFRLMQKKYEQKVSAYTSFPDGYYATPDGTQRVVLVYMPGKVSQVDEAILMKTKIEEAVRMLNPQSYAPDLEIHYSGGMQNIIEEQSALMKDLELSFVIVTVLVVLILFIYYRAFLATTSLLLSLFIGTLWTFGLAYFLVGYLNANTAFLGSIVIGNGINFGIIWLARYLEEYRMGKTSDQAIESAMRGTLTATLTAALAAGLAYGSLMLTSFRGFNQFGVIGFCGMILCWLSSYTLLPAYIVLFDKIRPLAGRTTAEQKHYFGSLIARMVARFPLTICIITLTITIFSIAQFPNFRGHIIETNMNNLRDKKCMLEGSGYYSHFVDDIFKRYLSPLVILPKNLEDRDLVATRLKKIKLEDGADSPIASVQTLEDFLPSRQNEKIALLKEIKDMLPQKIFQRLSEKEQALVHEFLNPLVFIPTQSEDLPQLIRGKFTEKDGSVGKMILVEPPLTDIIWNGKWVTDFVAKLRNATDSIRPGIAIAGQTPVLSDMISAIWDDGPKATLTSFIAVFILVVLLFRRFKIIALTLFALCLGFCWLCGFVLHYDLKINFLNFIALPITFGIGVDYGVNIFQRYQQEGSKNILTVIHKTGSAVMLASLTTIIGYSSLLLAGNQAFVSFGKLAVLGEITCVVAAVICLPALLCFRSRMKD